MNTALWIAQIVLAVVFLAAGFMKVAKSREELQPRMAYVESLTDEQSTWIGALEVLAAIGLILPAVTGILPILVPLAATGLVITMIVAAALHVRRGDLAMIIPNIVLGAMAAFVAWGRFGDHAF